MKRHRIRFKITLLPSSKMNPHSIRSLLLYTCFKSAATSYGQSVLNDPSCPIGREPVRRHARQSKNSKNGQEKSRKTIFFRQIVVEQLVLNPNQMPLHCHGSCAGTLGDPPFWQIELGRCSWSESSCRCAQRIRCILVSGPRCFPRADCPRSSGRR